MGVSISAQSIHRKKKQLLAKHSSLMSCHAAKFVEAYEACCGAKIQLDQVVDTYPPLKDARSVQPCQVSVALPVVSSTISSSVVMAPMELLLASGTPKSNNSPMHDLNNNQFGDGFESQSSALCASSCYGSMPLSVYKSVLPPTVHGMSMMQVSFATSSCSSFGVPVSSGKAHASNTFTVHSQTLSSIQDTENNGHACSGTDVSACASSSHCTFDTAFQLKKTLPYTVATDKQTKLYVPRLIDNLQKDMPPTIEILGDNFDLMRSPTYMTEQRQRQSWHWFLVVLKLVQVSGREFPDNRPKANIMSIPNSEFLPTSQDSYSLKSNLMFHVAKSLAKYLPHLKDVPLPEYIPHPFVQQTSQRTTFVNVELIDESENSSDGMIRIMKRLMEFVPHTHVVHPSVRTKITLEGDVLTCERAFAAQKAMQNGATDYERLDGFAHRPGGLHRAMNMYQVHFLLCILNFEVQLKDFRYWMSEHNEWVNLF